MSYVPFRWLVPSQRKVSQEDHLDMLVTDDSAIDRMRDFFQSLQ